MKFQRCRGFKLFRFGRYQAELWYCPAGEIIPRHTHPNIASRIMFLAGKMVFERDWNYLFLDWTQALRTFKVEPSQPHSARVLGKFGLFINFETWTGRPTSAAIDYVAAESNSGFLS
jgi:hypothetical protein